MDHIDIELPDMHKISSHIHEVSPMHVIDWHATAHRYEITGIIIAVFASIFLFSCFAFMISTIVLYIEKKEGYENTYIQRYRADKYIDHNKQALATPNSFHSTHLL
uniref:Uncharacterized protein n=1 Tax=Mimivirus LCMiAC01 TaxID=2506608 RepID=A0A481Z0T8_9VIRU|nr:MAG: hypothetical protein LCMiAC01_00680 [Mimivirus LCMiAC01]